MNNNKIITLPKRKEGRNISKNEDEHCPIFDGQDRRVEKIVTNRLRLDGEFKGEANHDRRESEVNDDSSGNNDLDQDFENEEDAQSMESVVALVAGTSPEISPPQTPVLSPAKPLIMSAPQNQKSRCRNFQNFTATLIDTFEFPFFGDRRYTSKNTFHWRGLDWNIFASMDGTKGLGFFIGSDVWKNISSDWSIHIRYKFEVLGDDDRVLLTSLSRDGRLIKNENAPHSRHDHGSWTVFDKDTVHKLYPSSQRATGFFKIKIRTTFEDICIPAVVPIGYNSKQVTGMVGLENLGATCYLNSLLQMLYHINSFRAAVYHLPHAEELLKNSTTLAMQSVFKNLQCSSKEVTTKDLTVAFGWTNAEAFMQQDVQEMMRVLIDKLEEKMKNTDLNGFIKDLFAGSIRSFIRCVNVSYESKRDEDFYDIQLDVKGCNNIYESFRKYTANEMLDGENQYDAGAAFGKQDAQKGVIFTKFPPVLTIHLKRFDFDMQSMGFRKIHDYYEFPERLELDQFLATDCPAESRAVPNVYVLHSVLVHSGDVGGGHYYAYIRPSKNFDYAAVSEGSSPEDFLTLENLFDGDTAQWFKFNDETVIQVEGREAIQHCYGRKKLESEGMNLRLMSSAYMLVYIRESEAAEIMRDISLQDIPKDLMSRLNEELASRRQIEMKSMRERMFCDLQFAVEEDVENFNQYNRAQDFLSERSFRTVKIMKDSTRLGAMLLISGYLNESPANLRLWTVERKKNVPNLRLSDDVLVKDLDHLIKLEKYYIQRLPVCEDIETFNVEFEDLKAQERSWLDILRQMIYTNMSDSDDLLTDEHDDPIEGCGIGMSNKPLQELIKSGVGGSLQLGTQIDFMTSRMMKLLESYGRDMIGDEMLTFFKVYDPWNLLRLRGKRGSDFNPLMERLVDGYSSRSSDSSPEASDQEDGDGSKQTAAGGSPDEKKSVQNAANNDGSVETKTLAVKPKKTLIAPMEYLPMKYIGSTVVGGKNHFSKLKDHFFDLLQQAAADDLPDVWTNKDNYRMFFSDSPLNTFSAGAIGPKVKNYAIESFLNTQDRSGRIVIIDVDPAAVEGYAEQLLFSMPTPIDWLRYRASRRSFQVTSFTPHDVDLLKEMQRIMALKNTSNVEVNDTDSVSDSQTTTKKRSSAESLESVKLSSLKASKPRSSSFHIYLPTYLSILETVQLIGERLGVDPSYLAIYFAVFHKNISFSRNWATHSYPNCIVGASKSTQLDLKFKASETIEDAITACSNGTNNIPRIAPKKFFIFFKILPFNITERGSKRFLDIKLTDFRLRSWRLLYIEHLRSQKAMSDLQSVRIGSSSASSKLPGGSQGCSDKEESIDRVSLSQDSPANVNAAPKKRRKQASTSISSDSTVSLSAVPSSPTVALKLPQIIWPTLSEETAAHLPALFEWHVAAYNNIYVSCDRNFSIGQLMEIIRQALAIPTNFHELLHLAPGAASKTLTEEQKHNLTQQRQQLMQHQDEIRSSLSDACCGKGAVVSDQIRVKYNKSTSAQDLASTTMAYGDDDDSETASAELDEAQVALETESLGSISSMLEVSPDYPLAIMSVRHNIIDEILGATLLVDGLVNTWPDCNCPFNNLFTVALQHVGVEDMLFMLSKHPQVKSCIVSVYNFTLLGNSVNVCSPDDFTGPFVSYIREDDTYHSMCQRFGEITGDSEKDWERCRLAVVRQKTPYFVPRPTKTDESAVAQQKPAATQKSVWSLLMEHNPEYARFSCDVKASVEHRNWRYYPNIGIQRPVADINQSNKSKGRRLGTGIRIV